MIGVMVSHLSRADVWHVVRYGWGVIFELHGWQVVVDHAQNMLTICREGMGCL